MASSAASRGVGRKGEPAIGGASILGAVVACLDVGPFAFGGIGTSTLALLLRVVTIVKSGCFWRVRTRGRR
jgi:hypothetical protein